MPNSKIKQPEHVRTAISKLSFCSTQAKSENGRGMECRGINGRIKLFFPLAPAGSCPYWGEGLTEKRASYSLICCLNPVLSSGCLHLLGLNNLPRHQRHEVPGMALRDWLMLYRGKVALKSRAEFCSKTVVITESHTYWVQTRSAAQARTCIWSTLSW